MWDRGNESDTYEAESIGIGVSPEVSWQIPTGHPIRNKLESRGDGDAQEGHYVWVYHTFPYCRLLAECL